MIFDLGGGTFDVSLLSIVKDEAGSFFQVLSTAGINDLGGHDFDQRIIDRIISKVREENAGIDLKNKVKEDRIINHRLFEAAERAKHELSTKLQTNINIPYLI